MSGVAGIDSWISLRMAVQNWMGRDDDETVSQIPLLISLGEVRIQRNQQWFTELYSVANGGLLTLNTNPFMLPTYIKTVTMLKGANASTRAPIEIVTPEILADFQNSNNDATGIPKFATITVNFADADTNGSRLTLWPGSGGDFDVDLKYIRRLPQLGPTQDSNVLLARHPDLYLYAALCESAPYLQHDERVPLWRDRYKEIVDEINLDREQQETAGMTRSRLPRSF